MALSSYASSPKVRSGAFAFIFAPIALTLMGSAMVDVQARTAYGQPLASVEGMLGMGLGSAIIALIALNCDLSSSGLFVTALWSIPVGILQLTGLLRIPGLFSLSMDTQDIAAAELWGLRPLATTLVLFASAIATWMIHHHFQKKLARKDPLHSSSSKEGEDITITARRRTPRQGPPTTTLRRRSLTPQQRIQRARHRRVRAVIAIMALPLAVGTFALYIDAAPRNVTRLGAEGLSALIIPGQPISHAAYGAAICAALVALAARWSLLGPQVSAWLLLVAPTYVLIPAWSTLSGNVVTPNQPFLIALSIASPVIASVGMVVGASTLAVHWTRRTYTPVEDESPEASSSAHNGDAGGAGGTSPDSTNEGGDTPAHTPSPA